jgi:hypothetical protein
MDIWTRERARGPAGVAFYLNDVIDTVRLKKCLTSENRKGIPCQRFVRLFQLSEQQEMGRKVQRTVNHQKKTYRIEHSESYPPEIDENTTDLWRSCVFR